MKRTSRKDAKKLNATAAAALKHFKPPENLSVSEWAEEKRVISRETAAEPGPWRTSRTPYLKKPMEAFTDPKVRKIVMVAASQVGKTELELNIIGYIIDQDPGSILYIHPKLEDARKFSRERVDPMIRDCKDLRGKVAEVKAKSGGNTILQKSFPGGLLKLIGTNSSSALASTPARYIIGDELDRWSKSAGDEGDPLSLAEARQATFYNAKTVEVSTPTVKGASNIEKSYYSGTQERWCHQCPECGEWHEIVFDDIKFEHSFTKARSKKVYKLEGVVEWACPGCGCLIPEEVIKKQPADWFEDSPDAYNESGTRSYWLNAFSSPWMPWSKIILNFLDAKDDPARLQVVYNTMLGQLWEDRGEIDDEETMLARREEYGKRPDGSDVELPDGVLVLTCGVDTQDNRLEYEIVGHGHYGETWGVRSGFIMGQPDDETTWTELDKIIDRVYRFRSGQGLRISATFIDMGGHYSTNVKSACRARFNKRVFAISGKGGESIPYTAPATKVVVANDKRVTCWHYTIGVDAGKAIIMSNLKVQESGPKFCHFPHNESAGYDVRYFNQLLSEKLVPTKARGGQVWRWEKIPGHTRNEALDCRNYALAALRIINPDMDAEERRLKGLPEPQKKIKQTTNTGSARNKRRDVYDDW